MKANPTLCVIIPVYNAEKFIEECIRSVQLQGFAEEELEIICIDDGSADRSGAILDRLAASMPNLRVHHQANAGVSAARNRGLSMAAGKFIAFVDADDTVQPGAMKRICELMERNGCAVAEFDAVTNNGYQPNREMKWAIADMSISGSIWRYVFLREQFGSLRFDETMRYGEDTLFAQTVLLNEPRCIRIKEQIYGYRDNPESVMRNRNYMVCADSMMKLALHHKEFLDENRFPGQERHMIRWRSRATAAYINYLLRAGDGRYPFHDLKEKGLWPYKLEWPLLRLHLTSKAGIRQTVSCWSLFFVGFRPTWWLLKKTGLLHNRG